MQCPHCRFENLDEKIYCVRCGKLMRIADVDTVPPRAKKRFFNVMSLFYALCRANGFNWKNINDATSPPRDKKNLFDIKKLFERIHNIQLYDLLKYSNLLRLLVPSLWQFAKGRKIRAWCFLGLLSAGILGSVLLIGTRFWSISFSLMALAYACSISDAFPTFGKNRMMIIIQRICFTGGFSILIYFSLYPLLLQFANDWLEGQIRVRVPPYYTNGEIQYGDIIELVRQDKYVPGDIVCSRGRRREFRNANMHGAIALQGIIIDRVIAVAGESVEIKENQLHYVGNNNPFPIEPLNTGWRFPDAKVNVGNNQYMIVPSYFNVNINPRANISPDIILLFEKANIDGKVTRIKYPLWRRKTFR